MIKAYCDMCGAECKSGDYDRFTAKLYSVFKPVCIGGGAPEEVTGDVCYTCAPVVSERLNSLFAPLPKDNSLCEGRR